MKVEKFKQLYTQLTGNQIIQQGKMLNNILAGTAATAITAGSILGLGKLSQIQTNNYKNKYISQQTANNQYNYQEKIQQPQIQIQPQQIINNNWIQNIAMPFIISLEGKVYNNGYHVLYDDDVNRTVKRKWDGKGGQAGIDAFIKSCIGKPTIGYGETDKDIIRKGKITDSEARNLLIQKLNNLDQFLSSQYKYYNIMNPNQKTALISFSYNLGKYFIETGTIKMKQHLYAGHLNQMCQQMRDCDNITQNNQLIKVKGLTRRRRAEMALFRTPYK